MMRLRTFNVRPGLSAPLFAVSIALLIAAPIHADEVPVPDMYAADPGYFANSAAGNSYYSSGGGGPNASSFGNDMRGMAQDIMSPAMVGPQVPPMPQMPSWVQAWAAEMSDTERDQLEDVYKGLRRINHALTGELMDASDAVTDSLKAKVRDPKSVGKAYARYFDIQRRWIEAQIAAANRVDELVAEVRERISQVPPPVLNPPLATPSAIGAPITIPPMPEMPPPGEGGSKP